MLNLSGNGANQTANVSSSNILPTVFNTKVMNKVDYNATNKKPATSHKNGGVSDIEMKDASKNIVSTK